MAIAFDAASGNYYGGTVNSLTLSHTCSGENRILFVSVQCGGVTDYFPTVTYAGVPMTQISKVRVPADAYIYLFCLIAPAKGANNIVVSTGSNNDMTVGGVSYTGVLQTGQPDAFTTNTATSTTSITTPLTIIKDSCWLVCCTKGTATIPAAGAGTTMRNTPGAIALFDSNGAKTPAGSYSLVVTNGSAGSFGTVIASFAPAYDITLKFRPGSLGSMLCQ